MRFTPANSTSVLHLASVRQAERERGREKGREREREREREGERERERENENLTDISISTVCLTCVPLSAVCKRR